MEIIMNSYVSWSELLCFTSNEMEALQLGIAIVMLYYTIKKSKK